MYRPHSDVNEERTVYSQWQTDCYAYVGGYKNLYIYTVLGSISKLLIVSPIGDSFFLPTLLFVHIKDISYPTQMQQNTF